MGETKQNFLPTTDLVRLFQEHAAGLAGAVRGIIGTHADAQGILQDAFLRAWRSRAEETRLGDPLAWIFVITMNLARDARRRRERRGPRMKLDEVDAVELSTREPGPATRFERGEALAAAREAIYQLAEPEKEVFLLRVSGELSFDGIAAALGIPVGTAKSRMRAALAELRTRLKAFAPRSCEEETR